MNSICLLIRADASTGSVQKKHHGVPLISCAFTAAVFQSYLVCFIFSEYTRSVTLRVWVVCSRVEAAGESCDLVCDSDLAGFCDLVDWLAYLLCRLLFLFSLVNLPKEDFSSDFLPFFARRKEYFSTDFYFDLLHLNNFLLLICFGFWTETLIFTWVSFASAGLQWNKTIQSTAIWTIILIYECKKAAFFFFFYFCDYHNWTKTKLIRTNCDFLSTVPTITSCD